MDKRSFTNFRWTKFDAALAVIMSVCASLLLALTDPTFADGQSGFDRDRGVVLPSSAATTILKRKRAGNEWKTEEWAITPEQQGHLEVELGAELEKVLKGRGSKLKVGDYYRQYMPAQWKDFHVIIVNAFDLLPSDAFPDRGIAHDQWRRELVSWFGGGCGAWYAVYVVEQDRLLRLEKDGRVILCNAPK